MKKSCKLNRTSLPSTICRSNKAPKFSKKMWAGVDIFPRKRTFFWTKRGYKRVFVCAKFYKFTCIFQNKTLRVRRAYLYFISLFFQLDILKATSVMQVPIASTINPFQSGCTIDQDSLLPIARNAYRKLRERLNLALQMKAMVNSLLKARASVANRTVSNLVISLPCHPAVALTGKNTTGLVNIFWPSTTIFLNGDGEKCLPPIRLARTSR